MNDQQIVRAHIVDFLLPLIRGDVTLSERRAIEAIDGTHVLLLGHVDVVLVVRARPAHSEMHRVPPLAHGVLA